MTENSTPTPENSSGASFAALDALAFANGKPKLTARLKQEFADFRVEEQLSFKFTEKGEHVYLWVEKIDRSTVDVAKKLSEVTGVHGSEIGYSGMKDRRAETGQWVQHKVAS